MRAMEDELAIAHAEAMALLADPKLRESFGQLAAQDQAHRASLDGATETPRD